MKRNRKQLMTLKQLQAIQAIIRRVIDVEHKKLHYDIIGLFSNDPDHHEHQTEMLKKLMQEDRFLKEAEKALCDLFNTQFQQE